MKVSNNTVITLEYVLMDDLGEILESSKEDGEYEYLHGIGEMLPGVEKALLGLEKGDSIDIVILPEDGFGIRSEEMIIEVDKNIFKEEATIEKGMEFDIEDDDGESIITVVELRGGKVLIDKNHPLAGKTLRVKAEVLDVRKAEDCEIEHWNHHHHEGCDHNQ